MCARLRHCTFQDDKKVFCQKHVDLLDGTVGVGEVLHWDRMEGFLLSPGLSGSWLREFIRPGVLQPGVVVSLPAVLMCNQIS